MSGWGWGQECREIKCLRNPKQKVKTLRIIKARSEGNLTPKRQRSRTQADCWTDLPIGCAFLSRGTNTLTSSTPTREPLLHSLAKLRYRPPWHDLGLESSVERGCPLYRGCSEILDLYPGDASSLPPVLTIKMLVSNPHDFPGIEEVYEMLYGLPKLKLVMFWANQGELVTPPGRQNGPG